MDARHILTKEFLQVEYIDSRKSSYQIASEVGCCAGHVIKYLRVHDIPVRGTREPDGLILGGMFSLIVHGASRRNIPFKVTEEYLYELYLQQGGKCALTGQLITIKKRRRDVSTASVDRIDSMIGYVKGNLQWVHKDINKIKQSYTQDYFIEMCQQVADHSRNKDK